MTQIARSDEWFETQKQFIAWVRSQDLNQFPEFKVYADLKDWELAYVMDTLLTAEIEITAERFNIEDLELELDSNALTLISMIYASRVVDASPSNQELYVETSLDLIKSAKEKEILRIQGSMPRWIAD